MKQSTELTLKCFLQIKPSRSLLATLPTPPLISQIVIGQSPQLSIFSLSAGALPCLFVRCELHCWVVQFRLTRAILLHPLEGSAFCLQNLQFPRNLADLCFTVVGNLQKELKSDSRRRKNSLGEDL